jgi:hypothetical protein
MTQTKATACAARVTATDATVAARYARRLKKCLLKLNSYFASATFSDLIVGGGDVVEGEELGSEERLEFVFVGECGEGFEDFPWWAR